MRPLAAALALAAIAALTALTALPGAATARPRQVEPQYVISFHGSFSVEESETLEDPTPYGCKGQASEDLHLSMSTQAVAVTSPRPLGKEGRYRYTLFSAPLQGLTGTDSADTIGHWEVEPGVPFAPDPSVCVFTPGHADATCTFAPVATNAEGPTFELQSDPHQGGRFYLGRLDSWIDNCRPAVGLPLGDLFDEPLLTRLSVGKLLALAKGHSISDSGSVTLSRPPGSLAGMIPGTAHGTETNTYRLTIKRVR